MLIKIIRQIFIYIFFPQGFFFYSCYFNDFFNLDLFNLRKITDLSEELSEIKNFIKEQNQVSNQKLESIGDVTSNSNNIGIYLITLICIFGACYIGYNFFNNDAASAAQIISEQVSDQNKTLSNNILKSSSTIIKNQADNALNHVNVMKNINISVVETIKEQSIMQKNMIQVQNNFIEEQSVNLLNVLKESFIVVQQNFFNNESKLNLLMNRLNLLLNNFDIDPSLANSTNLSNSADNSSYVWGQGESLNGEVKIKGEFKLDPKRLKFDE